MIQLFYCYDKVALTQHSYCLQNSPSKEHFKECVGWVRWLTPVIPGLWEAKVGRSRGQEVKTILANMVKPCLY